MTLLYCITTKLVIEQYNYNKAKEYYEDVNKQALIDVNNATANNNTEIDSLKNRIALDMAAANIVIDEIQRSNLVFIHKKFE